MVPLKTSVVGFLSVNSEFSIEIFINVIEGFNTAETMKKLLDFNILKDMTWTQHSISKSL